MSSANFSSVPVLDYSLVLDPATKPEFMVQFRDAIINVGFMYLSNTPIEKSVMDEAIRFTPKFFELPEEAKQKLKILNSPHFLGYSTMGEYTKGKLDQREQLDFGTEYESRWVEGDPECMRMWGPSQWPDGNDLPGFKEAMMTYCAQAEKLSYDFIDLVTEILGLPPRTMDIFYEGRKPRWVQNRSKVIKYPARDENSSDQGVGPHFDPGFLTFLLQCSPHVGLQAQNISGQWIDIPPIDGTIVVNFGKALEYVTHGIARATSHRVLSPPIGSTPRYSIPFLQTIGQDLRLADMQLDIAPEIRALREGGVGETDSVNFGEYGKEMSGKVWLIGRSKSHPGVAEKFYPETFKEIFPKGLPVTATAY